MSFPAVGSTRMQCARIVFEEREYKTENFAETKWRQSSPIHVHNGSVGQVENRLSPEETESRRGTVSQGRTKAPRCNGRAPGQNRGTHQGGKEWKAERDFAENRIQRLLAIVLVLDTEGRIVRINPYLEEISGYRLQEVKVRTGSRPFLPERYRDQLHPCSKGR